MVRVKICGITRPEDAALAAEAGADAIGLVFAESPRRIDLERATAIVGGLPPFVTPVALFVNETPQRMLDVCSRLRVRAVQLSGDEPARVAEELVGQGIFTIKAFHVREAADLAGIDAYPAQACLLDACVAGRYGGTGETFDWGLAARAATAKPVILAGGLRPENVADAVRQVRPYAVDVSSGVEAEPGIKDAERVRAFVRAARSALGEGRPAVK
ncbi:MAG: phosphoribosylanthranilate isomerase [bacterium]